MCVWQLPRGYQSSDTTSVSSGSTTSSWVSGRGPVLSPSYSSASITSDSYGVSHNTSYCGVQLDDANPNRRRDAQCRFVPWARASGFKCGFPSYGQSGRAIYTPQGIKLKPVLANGIAPRPRRANRHPSYTRYPTRAMFTTDSATQTMNSLVNHEQLIMQIKTAIVLICTLLGHIINFC